MITELIMKIGKDIYKDVCMMVTAFFIGLAATSGAICAAYAFNVAVVIAYDKEAHGIGGE